MRALKLAGLIFAVTSSVHAATAPSKWIFEENGGRTDASVRFAARGTGYRAYFTDDRVVLQLGEANPGVVLALAVSASGKATVAGEVPAENGIRYVALGRSGIAGREIAAFERLRYRGVAPGADLVFYGRDGELEFDLELAPGADLGAVRLEVVGASSMTLDSSGALRLSTSRDPLRLHPPFAYQVAADGRREEVASAFVIDPTAGSLGFRVGAYDRARALVIDPVLVYSTYLGGSDSFLGGQMVRDVAMDAAGHVYAVGQTNAFDFPVFGAGSCDNELNDAATFSSCSGSAAGQDQFDAFVTKFAADGATVLYSTYLGGPLSEIANAVAVNAAGEAYVAGRQFDSFSPGTTGQAFLVRMRADGGGALFATIFGDAGASDVASDVLLDPAENVFLAGYTESAGLNPAPPNQVPGFDQSYGGGGDGFLRKYSQSATTNALVASTYVGGGLKQDVQAIARGTDGSIVAVGTDFGTDQVLGDISVKRFAASLTTAPTAVLVEGNNGTDIPWAVAVDSANQVWIAGETFSSNFCDSSPPLPGFDQDFAEPSDGFAFRLNAGLTAANYCTYAGSPGCDRVKGIALTGDTVVALAGSTQPGASSCGQTTLANAFLLQLATSPSALRFRYTFGSVAGVTDESTSLAAGPAGLLAMGGLVGGSGFATTPGSAYPTNPGGDAGFVMVVDPVTRVSIGDVSGNEGNSGTHNLAFDVSLNGTPLDNVTYSIATQDGTATQPSDYTQRSATCSNCFTPLGAKSRVENVAIVGDTAVEPNETFQLNLTSVSANAVIGDGSGTGTIVNDDAAAGTLQFSGSTLTVAESGATALLSVTRTGGSSGAASVHCKTIAGGTATAGSDYTTTDQTLSWANGDAAAKTCSIPILNDTADEPNETISVQLQTATGATIGAPATATITITDDDDAPGTVQFTVTTLNVAESAGSAQISISRTGGAGGAASVHCKTIAGGTATAGADYTTTDQTLSWANGDSAAKTCSVPILNDSTDEPNETISLQLQTATGAAIGAPAAATVTITDDDDAPGTLQFTATSVTVAEGAGSAQLVVSRTGGGGGAASVHCRTIAGGTATAGSDYTTTDQTLSWANGDTSTKTCTIPILNDGSDEPNETISVQLQTVTGATIGAPATATLTITDDDLSLTIFVDGFASGSTGAWSSVAP
ncbi:MAG: Calx-beta domain-containing protein [Thermoanaerobaculia bacterium]